MIYNNFIAALDIGSTKLTLTLATRTTTGELNIIDSESTETSSVKYGRITNENTVAKEIQALILKVQQRQGAIIEKVDVTTAGAMLKSEKKTITKELGEGSIVTEETLRSLESENYTTESEDDEILDVRALSFNVDGEDVEEATGKSCHKIQATYLVIKGHSESIEKIKKTLRIAEVQMADMFIAPIAIAKATLTAKERQQGAAAVEIGHSSTKIAIYHEDKLHFVATIPLGSQLITNDLSGGLDIKKETAEALKKDSTFGAVCSNLVEDADIVLSNTINVKKNHSSKLVVEIIEARVEEILLNIMHQIETSGFMYLLRSGLVISGGISSLKNLTQFANIKTNLNTRIAEIQPHFSSNSSIDIKDPKDAEMCGILLLGESNCKKTERKEIVEEQPIEKKEKKNFTKGVGSFISGLFDDTDEQID